MKGLTGYAVWALVVGGVLWGYQGVTGVNLLSQVLGAQLAMIVEIIVGVSGVWVGYQLLTGGMKVKN